MPWVALFYTTYCNFTFCNVFIKSHLTYRSQKTDFDLQPTSVIYTRCKAIVIDDTERLQIKILRHEIIISTESMNLSAIIAIIT